MPTTQAMLAGLLSMVGVAGLIVAFIVLLNRLPHDTK
jgi:hypothetical protein